MHLVNLRNLDLNLLVVFDAIYTEGGITRAAKTLHLTQPAVTHALNRLRMSFGDPLFERSGRSMIPTPKARQWIQPTRDALRGIEIMLGEAQPFDPASADRSFTIGMRDMTEPTLLPALMRRFQVSAPGARLQSVQTERRQMDAELASGAMDVAIDVALPHSASVQKQQLSSGRLVVAARRGHPAVGDDLDLPVYLAQGHVLATVRRRGGGMEDVELERLGMKRDIRLRCQHYFAALEVVRDSDLILTMPEGYARAADAGGHLQILPLPLDVPATALYLYWHQNVNDDAANVWLREQVRSVLSESAPL